KSRFAVDCYAHADGKTPEEVAGNVQKFMAAGFRHVRIQLGGYGGTGALNQVPDFKAEGFGYPGDNFMNEHLYLKSIPKLFETVRKICGDEVELLHDVHERVQPMDVINMIKKLED